MNQLEKDQLKLLEESMKKDQQQSEFIRHDLLVMIMPTPRVLDLQKAINDTLSAFNKNLPESNPLKESEVASALINLLVSSWQDLPLEVQIGVMSAPLGETYLSALQEAGCKVQSVPPMNPKAKD